MKRFLLALVATVLVLGCAGPAPDGTGAPAADFRVERLSEVGAFVNFTEFKGKPVLLDFWATWCGPCRETMPFLDTLYKKYNPQGLEMMGITTEERSVVEKFIKQKPTAYPIFLDGMGAANKAHDVSGYPTAVLVNRDGKVVWRGHPGDEAALEAAIKKVLE